MSEQETSPINPLEIDLEDAIEEAYSRDPDILRNRGLPLYGKMLRQFPLSGYGVPDLMTWSLELPQPGSIQSTRRLNTHGTLLVDIVELKRGDFKPDDLTQLCRYMSGVEDLFNQTFLFKKFTLEVNGHLVVRNFPPSQVAWIIDHIPNLTLYEWSLDIERGIRFDSIGDWIGEKRDATELERYSTCSEVQQYYRDLYKAMIPTTSPRP